MAKIDEFERLADELRRGPVPLVVECTSFTGGAIWLDAKIANRLFVLAYIPSWNRYGVDEVADDEGFDTHFRHNFQDFEPAKQQLLTLLQGAAATAVPA